MALKSTKMGGLDVGDGMEGGKNMVQMGWDLINGTKGLNDHYDDRGGFPYSFSTVGVTQDANGTYVGGEAKNGSRTAIGLCCGVFLGMGQGDLKMETMANDVMERAFGKKKDSNYQLDTWPPPTISIIILLACSKLVVIALKSGMMSAVTSW